jgi:ribosomal protein S17E
MTTSTIPYVLGSDSITVYLKGQPYPINKQAHTYNMVLAAIKANDVPALERAINIKEGINSALTTASKSIRILNDKIFYEDREIQGLITARIFEVIRLGMDTSPMIKFLENLMQNPSKRAVDELFGFMEACTLPITPDGHFLAYKRINEDYMDIHSGTVLNKPAGKLTKSDRAILKGKQGKKQEVTVKIIDGVTTVSMPRNLVDDDKNNTCSEGLHFCSYDYLQHFNGARVVVLKINPMDVSSVPVDYNNSKGRTCKYQVVDEIEVQGSMLTKKIQDGFVDSYNEDTIVTDDPLTDVQIKYIRDTLHTGSNTVKELATYYKRSERTIRRIRDREAYKHVK